MRAWSLVLCCLCTSPLAAQPDQGSAAPAQDKWLLEVPGFGLTVADAKLDALKHIAENITAVLARQRPPLTAWQPSVDYVKSHVIQGSGYPGQDGDLEGVGPTKSWIYPVKPLDLAALAALDREAGRAQRRVDRIRLATLVFGAFAVILAVLTAYLRLDRWTGGRYRRRLQMAAWTVLGVAGAGWCWLQ